VAKVKAEDTVIVISGRDKGKTGRVLEVIKKNRQKGAELLIVEGIQQVKKHNKIQQQTNGRQGTTGGIETINATIPASNVMVVDPVSKKGTRVGYKSVVKEISGVKKAKRTRVAKASGKEF
jgi:large subunit ribosomal protein L24